MKYKIGTFMLLILAFRSNAQRQVEFDFYNGINIVSIYNKTPNERVDISGKGGNIFDPGRISMNLKYNYGKKSIFYSVGMAYSQNTYDFSVGEFTPTTRPDTYYYIFQDYKTAALLLGIKKRWTNPNKNISLSLGIDLLPSFLLSFKGTYADKYIFEHLKSNQFIFNSVDSRLVFSIQFLEKSNFHFNIHGFAQPPSIYLSNVLKANLVNVNIGFGFGLVYEIAKKE